LPDRHDFPAVSEEGGGGGGVRGAHRRDAERRPAGLSISLRYHAPFPVWSLSKNLGSGREAMPLNIIDWHGNIPRPPALFSTAAFLKKIGSRLHLSPGHVNPPPEAPVPSHQTTVMIGVPDGT